MSPLNQTVINIAALHPTLGGVNVCFINEHNTITTDEIDTIWEAVANGEIEGDTFSPWIKAQEGGYWHIESIAKK